MQQKQKVGFLNTYEAKSENNPLHKEKRGSKDKIFVERLP
jgi:hypothetical protein